MLISTVADIPNTRKNRRAFPAISLKETMIVVVVLFAERCSRLYWYERFYAVMFFCSSPLWGKIAIVSNDGTRSNQLYLYSLYVEKLCSNKTAQFFQLLCSVYAQKLISIIFRSTKLTILLLVLLYCTTPTA